jgi:hypothetical protein
MGIPIIGDVIDAVKDLVSEVIVDKDKKNEINLELERIADQADARLHAEMIAQTETNKVEASHRSVFVAGWRPFIGWVGGAGIAWTFVVSPVAEWASRLFGWSGVMPVIDAGQLTTLVLAMLGVGAMRSYDKSKGTANDVLPIGQGKKNFIDKAVSKVENLLPENAPWIK